MDLHLGVATGLALLGVPVGAFLNVVIERTPDRTPLRVAREGDAFPAAAWLGVPVQPWILRGPGPRRRRWLAVEVATALVFGALGARYGDSSVVLPLLLLGACLVAVSAVDLEHLRIPDRITFPTLAVALPAVAVVSLRLEVGDAIRGALVGSATYFVILLLPHLAYPRGMGFGDVKLALVMGLYLGWMGWTQSTPITGPVRLVLYALMLGCLLGVVFGLVHAAVTRRRGEFPFGPALALACLVVIFFAPDLRI
ncbi:MAG: A24 family peptidase [Acidimicrobiales bacterium]|nr:A24 family peptidase [Acidimicrobiales bacterium]